MGLCFSSEKEILDRNKAECKINECADQIFKATSCNRQNLRKINNLSLRLERAVSQQEIDDIETEAIVYLAVLRTKI